nr:uncharacterized protein LOC105867725 [Microcebus murinus]
MCPQLSEPPGLGVGAAPTERDTRETNARDEKRATTQPAPATPTTRQSLGSTLGHAAALPSLGRDMMAAQMSKALALGPPVLHSPLAPMMAEPGPEIPEQCFQGFCYKEAGGAPRGPGSTPRAVRQLCSPRLVPGADFGAAGARAVPGHTPLRSRPVYEGSGQAVPKRLLPRWKGYRSRSLPGLDSRSQRRGGVSSTVDLQVVPWGRRRSGLQAVAAGCSHGSDTSSSGPAPPSGKDKQGTGPVSQAGFITGRRPQQLEPA